MTPEVRKRLVMCARIQDTVSRYSNISQVKSMLDYLGLDTIRCGHYRAGVGSSGNYVSAANAGIKMVMTVRDGRQPDEIVDHLEQFEASHPGVIVAIEGPNEIDHNPVTWIAPNGTILTDTGNMANNHPAAALAFQRDLYERVRTSSLLGHLPVVAFSDFQQLNQPADYHNTHPYPRHGALLNVESALKGPVKYTWITETGAPHRPDPRFYANATPESQSEFIVDAVGKVLADERIRMMCIFQLMDSYNATTPEQIEDMEYSFGLFDYDYQPKPAAVALRGLLQSMA